MPREAADWQERADGSVWVIGMTLTAEYIDRLCDVRYLTLYDTKVGPGVLSALRNLELLDLRTLSVAALDQLRDLPNLRGLALSHDRKTEDLDVVGFLPGLEYLEVYALSRIERLPDMRPLSRLRRISIGQMIRLADWTALLTAPSLEALDLQNKLTPDLDVLARLAEQRTFRYFRWSASDESDKKLAAATAAADRPAPATYMRLRDLWTPTAGSG